MPRLTKINEQIRNYPDIMEKSNSYDGMDYLFFDDEPDYDEELDLQDYERVD